MMLKKCSEFVKRGDIVIALYLLVYFIVLGIIHYLHGPIIIGEWDDYTMPIASIIYGHHFSIYPQDVENYFKLIPDWAEYRNSYGISPFYTRNGGQMAFYFPTYAIVCVPVILLLKVMNRPTTYTFILVNLFFLMVALIFIARKLKDLPFWKRFLLILALSINPIIFYISWPSAEVLIYALIVMGITYWYKGNTRKAAILISIAGTMNPTVLAIGIVMILSWFIKLVKNRDKQAGVGAFIKTNLKDAIEYACCYVIGIVPMIYNYYNVGRINLTAQEGSVVPFTTTLRYMWAYLTDWNFGYLPYFPIVLILSLILLIIAIIKKNTKYITWMLAFFATVFSYSLMIYINCGMSGISRYNAWCSSFLVLGVLLFMEELINIKQVIKVMYSFVLVGIVYLGCIIYVYSPVASLNVPYYSMSPVATFILDNVPSLYNPLPTTFNSRVNNIDGGTDYKTPIVYQTEDGYVTKILASSKDMDELLDTYTSNNGHEEWFKNKVQSLKDTESYISIPKRYGIIAKSE